MKTQEAFLKLEQTARSHKISIARVCRAAGIAESTFQSGKKGKKKALLETHDSLQEALTNLIKQKP